MIRLENLLNQIKNGEQSDKPHYFELDGVNYTTSNQALISVLKNLPDLAVRNTGDLSEGKVTYSTYEVYRILGISKNTLFRWEKDHNLNIKRDWRGWRLYSEDNIQTLKYIKQDKI